MLFLYLFADSIASAVLFFVAFFLIGAFFPSLAGFLCLCIIFAFLAFFFITIFMLYSVTTENGFKKFLTAVICLGLFIFCFHTARKPLGIYSRLHPGKSSVMIINESKEDIFQIKFKFEGDNEFKKLSTLPNKLHKIHYEGYGYRLEENREAQGHSSGLQHTGEIQYFYVPRNKPFSIQMETKSYTENKKNYYSAVKIDYDEEYTVESSLPEKVVRFTYNGSSLKYTYKGEDHIIPVTKTILK